MAAGESIDTNQGLGDEERESRGEDGPDGDDNASGENQEAKAQVPWRVLPKPEVTSQKLSTPPMTE